MKNKSTLLLMLAAIILLSGALILKINTKQALPPNSPTAQEKAETQIIKEQNKKAEAKAEEQARIIEKGKQVVVTPVITSARQNDREIFVAAYIPQIFENNGECTLTASKGSEVITKTGAGFANASTTDCAPFIIDRSTFGEAGEWKIIVSYSSSNFVGSSPAVGLEIK